MPSHWNQGELFGRRYRKLPALVLPLALAACGTTITGLVSAPLPPEGWSKNDYHWKFESEELSLDVGAGNFHPRGEQRKAPSVLTIWMRFRALAGGIEFYPHRVTLTPERDESRTPMTVRGPYRLGLDARMRLPRGLECAGVGVLSLGSRSPGGQELAVGESVPIDGRVCFGLDFEVDSSPSRPFLLGLGGVEIAGAPVRLPQVRFVAAEYEIYFDPYYGTPDFVHVRPVSGG